MRPPGSDVVVAPALASQHHLTLVGGGVPGQDVKQRGLARAVRADEPDDGAVRHVEGDAVDRSHAAEVAVHVTQRQQGCGHAGRSALRDGRW